jgi:hypothetical protein
LGKGHPVNELHRDVGLSFYLTNLEYLADSGVVDASLRTGLLKESG